MKKIDILNFITEYRRNPNNARSYDELLMHLGPDHEQQLIQLLAELQQLRTVRESEVNGKKVYQVISK